MGHWIMSHRWMSTLEEGRKYLRRVEELRTEPEVLPIHKTTTGLSEYISLVITQEVFSMIPGL